MVNQKDMENTTGTMVAFSKDILKTAFAMAVVYGKEDQTQQILMKESMLTIKNVGREFLLGLLEILTKDSILTISDMVMGKCIGRMAHIIKDFGKGVFSTEKEKCACLGKIQNEVFLSLMYLLEKLITKIIQLINKLRKQSNWLNKNYLCLSNKIKKVVF